MTEKEYKAFLADLRELSKLPHFRKFLWEVLSYAEIYQNPTDKEQALFLAGQREVGLRIIHLLNEADPTIYPRLLLEKAEKDYAESHGAGS